MILLDTGPLVALFNPRDSHHETCRAFLETVREPLVTTLPVLTETVHLLSPSSKLAKNAARFVLGPACDIWWMDDSSLWRAVELMERYSELPMDFADASLVTAAERLEIQQIFTLDHRDFSVYRFARGRTNQALWIVP